jgi:Ca2+/Na+ antiporter
VDLYKTYSRILAVGGLLFLIMAVSGNTAFYVGLASLLFLASVVIKLVSRRKRRHAEKLRSRGRQVDAEVQKVELNKNFSVGGVNPYIIWSRWVDSSTGETRQFKSGNLWFDPTDYVAGKTVPVFMAVDNPEDYYMDLSFLPKDLPYRVRQEKNQKTPIPVPKKARRLGLAGKIALVFLAIVLLKVVVCMWKSNPKAAMAWYVMLFFVAFVVAGVILTVRQLSKIIGFKCPQCRTRIWKPTDTRGKADVPICFYCEKCDIIWDSGVRTPTSD